MEEDRETLRVQLEVAQAAARWERGGRQEEDLWRGGRLARVGEMENGGYLPLAELEREFWRPG